MASALQFFTHAIDGAVYGAWYRILSAEEVEVIGVGMLEQGSYAGFSAESAARSILENFVRQRRTLGAPVPSLEVLPAKRERSPSASAPKKHTQNQTNAALQRS